MHLDGNSQAGYFVVAKRMEKRGISKQDNKDPASPCSGMTALASILSLRRILFRSSVNASLFLSFILYFIATLMISKQQFERIQILSCVVLLFE